MTAINCRSLYADAGAAIFGSDVAKPLKCLNRKGDLTWYRTATQRVASGLGNGL